MNTIRINTASPYDIHIGQGLLQQAGERVAALCPGGRAAIITDDIVNLHYGDALRGALTGAGLSSVTYEFENGERSKTLSTVADIYSFLSGSGVSRDDIILALGGGVVGDIAGFAAATYLRGVPFVQLPTTLLAAVDSSVGGKTGVDIKEGKNLVGAFWQPALVLCDLNTFSTLPEAVFCDGSAEVLKYGALYDEALFENVAAGALRTSLEEVVCRCVALKRDAVERDERDTGMRQLLNFGHTIGHAIEALSDFSIGHGRAVAAGMAEITARTQKLGLTEPGTSERLTKALRALQLPERYEGPAKPLCPVILGDKKRHGNSISFVILNRIGKSALYPVPVSDVERLLCNQ